MAKPILLSLLLLFVALPRMQCRFGNENPTYSQQITLRNRPYYYPWRRNNLLHPNKPKFQHRTSRPVSEIPKNVRKTSFGFEGITDLRTKKYNKNIAQNCKAFTNPRMRETCRRISQNPVFVSMENQTAGYVGIEESIVQDRMLLARGLRLREEFLTKEVCNSEVTCPDYSLGAEYKKESMRSLSPWTMCQQYNPKRFPQWINTAKCLCKHCINPLTMREEPGQVMSQPITVEVTVIKKKSLRYSFSKCTKKTCDEVVENVAIACHCSLLRVT